MFVYDGHVYKSENDIPDLGSWECVEVEALKRTYYGFSQDIDKLPKYDDLGTGSLALCLDTGACYTYHALTKEWYLL